MRLCFAALVLALSPIAATAQGCFGAGQPQFHCTVQGGKKAVDVCLQGDVALYRFGPAKGAAELLLARHATGVHMTPWSGVGSSIWEELTFFNSTFEYRINYSVSRIAAEFPDVRGGVTVLNGGDPVTELECDKGSVEFADFYALYEAKEASGQCWSRDSFTWGGC